MLWLSFVKIFFAARAFLLWQIDETRGANEVRLEDVVAGEDLLWMTHVRKADWAIVIVIQRRKLSVGGGVDIQELAEFVFEDLKFCFLRSSFGS